MAQSVKKLGAFLHSGGVEFRVWAPFAQNVELIGTVTENNEIGEFVKDDQGNWSTFVDGALPGQSYKYIITSSDGNRLERNDPYARQLTVSDGGFSVIVNDAFDWSEDSFVAIPKEQQVIYELHVGTFNRPDPATPGTFISAIGKLEYLKSLGITTIELMPVTSMATSYGWGYSPNHMFSIENTYGGRHGLMEFVRACHDLGMAVVVDVIYNHFSTQTDIWQFDGWSENGRGGIYFYNDARGDTPWGGRPDYGREEVRRFLLDNITMWFTEYHVDGLRVDSTVYMRNSKGLQGDESTAIPEAWTLLQDMVELAKKINPDALLIAEDSSGLANITAGRDNNNGLGFSAQWGLGFPYDVRRALGILYGSERSLDGVAGAMEAFYNNDAFQKLIFSDSHDTAANGGTRLNESASPYGGTDVLARKRALAANAFLLTAPGIPMLLQGEEFMQRGSFNDWQMLDWEKTTQFAGIVLAHQHLTSLRRNLYGTSRGLIGHNAKVFHRNDTNGVLGYHRWENGGPGDDVLIVINFGEDRISDYALTFPLPGTWRVRFNSAWSGYSPEFQEVMIESVEADQNGTTHLTLSDHQVMIFTQDLPDTSADA